MCRPPWCRSLTFSTRLARSVTRGGATASTAGGTATSSKPMRGLMKHLALAAPRARPCRSAPPARRSDSRPRREQSSSPSALHTDEVAVPLLRPIDEPQQLAARRAHGPRRSRSRGPAGRGSHAIQKSVLPVRRVLAPARPEDSAVRALGHPWLTQPVRHQKKRVVERHHAGRHREAAGTHPACATSRRKGESSWIQRKAATGSSTTPPGTPAAAPSRR